LTEWFKAPNTMIGNWWCSVSIVRVQFSSRDTETLSAHTSNCNNVGIICYTYIGIYIYNYLDIPSIFQSAEQESEVFLTHQWLNVTNSTNKKQKTKQKKKKRNKSLLMHMDEEIIYPSILRLCLHLYILQEYVTWYQQRISETIVGKSIITHLFFSWK
jgi:hypothetical protein